MRLTRTQRTHRALCTALPGQNVLEDLRESFKADPRYSNDPAASCELEDFLASLRWEVRCQNLITSAWVQLFDRDSDAKSEADARYVGGKYSPARMRALAEAASRPHVLKICAAKLLAGREEGKKK